MKKIKITINNSTNLANDLSILMVQLKDGKKMSKIFKYRTKHVNKKIRIN